MAAMRGELWCINSPRHSFWRRERKKEKERKIPFVSTLFRVSTVPGNERPEIRRIRWDGGKFKITEISLKSRGDHRRLITWLRNFCKRYLHSDVDLVTFHLLLHQSANSIRHDETPRETWKLSLGCSLVRNEISIAVCLAIPRANQVPWERLTNFVSCKNSLLHVRQCMLIATRNTRRLSSLSICYFNPGSNYVRWKLLLHVTVLRTRSF